MASPSIEITLAPEVADGVATGIRVSFELRGLVLTEEDTLCRLPQILVGVAGAAVTDDGVTATDDAGTIPLGHAVDDPTPTWTFRRWRPQRTTQGTVRVEYFAPVRVVTAATTNGPLYDLRAEGPGVSAAGVSFLALPDREEELTAQVAWDLSHLPAGARGVSSHGEGTVHRTATAEQLTYTFFMAGPVSSHPQVPGDTFGMYWLSETKFDASEVGRHVELLYQQMCAFFRDPDPGYRVFVRKHPFVGNGGSALPGSRGFMFGWSDEKTQTTAALKRLLEHETVHNWTLLDGDPAEVSWYNEGTAEYYSLLLTLRTGVIDEDTFVSLLNERAHGYYGNPVQTLSSAEAARIYWTDWRAQRVPYGRGQFYLLDVDHKIRQASEGRRSLDDIIWELLDRKRAGQETGVDAWIELITAELGQDGRKEYEAMMAGQWVLPSANCLSPRFTGREEQIRQLDVGFNYSSFRTQTVSGVVQGGNADRVGIRDGDQIVQAPAPHSLPSKPAKEITLTLARDGQEFEVTYEPFGDLVPGMLWEKTG